MKQTRTSGVIQGKSSIAYAFDFLPVADEEAAEYLVALGDHFLRFLERESKKPCDHVRFGGIRFVKEEGGVVLQSAFCPFSERAYRPVAKLFFDEDGKLCSLQKEKRSRRK